MRSILIGVVVALLAGQAVAADQFDLVCKGWTRDRVQGPKQPLEVRYRVDAAAKLWCQADCHLVQAIQEITPGMITFRSNLLEAGRQSDFFDQTISRSSGELTDFMAGSYIYWERGGTCEPAPFSGFPAGKF